MLWIALHFRRLALEAILRARRAPEAGHDGCRAGLTHGPPGGPPLAVCDRQQVLHVCPVAWARGVRPGMRRVTALAVSADLLAVERDEAAERDALAQLAGWTLRFTPAVSLQPPDGVLLEAAGSLRLFGGLPPLLQALHAGLAALGFSAGHGVAPTATGAWLLARAGRPGARAWPPAQGGPQRLDADPPDAARLAERLAGLPAALLDAAAPHAGALAGMGVNRIADLLRLPRAGVARRFGEALLDELDRAHGHRPEPRAWFQAPQAFDARLVLPGRVEAAEALVFAARRLLTLAAHWLAVRQAGTTHLAFEVEHEARAPTPVALRLAGACRDAERFAALARERLAAVRLPAPACGLRLRCDRTLPLAPDSGALFADPAGTGDDLSRLLERLQARLGRERVLRLLPADDHRPERAYRVERADAPPSAGRQALPGATGLPRPLWLMRAPLPLAQRDGQPWLHGPLRLRLGPERIEAGWWDAQPVQRDYYVAEDDQAALYWVFRARPEPDAPAAWFLQGRFG